MGEGGSTTDQRQFGCRSAGASRQGVSGQAGPTRRENYPLEERSSIGLLKGYAARHPKEAVSGGRERFHPLPMEGRMTNHRGSPDMGSGSAASTTHG